MSELSPNRRLRFGFTLIELLIVVAIIAILAAIAVPNFLEAQTRAKVSRAKADQRAVATALETYRIDYNIYPWWEPANAPNISRDWEPSSNYGQGGSRVPLGIVTQLTTPIAYITTVKMNDPFTAQKVEHTLFAYVEQSGNAEHGVTGSFGYDRDRETMKLFMPYATSTSTIWGLFSMGPDGHYYEPTPWPQGHAHWVYYDPTNGTTSEGNIWRFGP